MRLKRDTIGSMLQGVSEQPPSRRVEGQNTAQVNMISDSSAGLRRRSGLRYLQTLTLGNTIENGKFYGTYMATKNGYRHLLINTVAGDYAVLDSVKVAQGTAASVANGKVTYLSGGKANDIQTTSVTGVTYVANTSRKVDKLVDNTGKINPYHTGFFYVVAGAYSTTYTVTAGCSPNGAGATATYTTPSGTTTGDAAKSTPEYIATQLATQLTNTMSNYATVYREGCYVGIITKAGNSLVTRALDVSSGTSTAYIVTSNVSNVKVESFLAARLPKELNGALCSVGASESTMSWYKYTTDKGAWVETGAWDSPSDTRQGTPLKMKDDGTLEHMRIEGRNAGNDENNEMPQFLKTGIVSGIGTYGGRLVFLSDAYVCMSASGKPNRFFRTTVNQSLGSDRVDIASGSAQNTTYRQAIQYNKDLIVIGDDAQAVIPFSTSKANDSVSLVITSTMTCNSSVVPVQTLKTLMYPTGADTGYASVLELTPSSVSSSLYTTDDVTSHIQRYIKGDIRFMAGNPSWGLCVVGTEGDLKTLVVNECLFDDAGKVQNAWHKWTFDRDILWAYAGNDFIYLVFKGTLAGEVVMYSIDPAKESEPKSVHMDYNMLVPVVNDVGNLPHQLENYARSGNLACVYDEGRLEKCQVVMRYSPDFKTFTLERITGDPFTGRVMIGVPFTSTIEPTSPLARNKDGMAMLSSKSRLLRYEITAYNSGGIVASVKDTATATEFDMDLPAVVVQSNDLELDKPLVAEYPMFTIPCRTRPATTQISMSTTGLHDMHFISCDYIIKRE